MLQLNHKKLEVYKKGLKFVKEVYAITRRFPRDEQFGLTSQIRRASVSFLSNLSEGSARKSSSERKRFYEISRSSPVEVDTQFVIAFELEIIKQEEVVNLDDLLIQLFSMISSMIDKQ
jgi:four helix bundle protein